MLISTHCIFWSSSLSPSLSDLLVKLVVWFPFTLWQTSFELLFLDIQMFHLMWVSDARGDSSHVSLGDTVVYTHVDLVVVL